jgi:hypothetical protein
MINILKLIGAVIIAMYVAASLQVFNTNTILICLCILLAGWVSTSEN